MLDLSDFVDTTPIAREVTYKGKTKTFHFRELGADEAESLFLGVDSDPKKNKGLRNKIISQIVVTENGEKAFKTEEAGKLPNELANLLNGIALELNGVGKAAAEEAKKTDGFAILLVVPVHPNGDSTADRQANPDASGIPGAAALGAKQPDRRPVKSPHSDCISAVVDGEHDGQQIEGNRLPDFQSGQTGRHRGVAEIRVRRIGALRRPFAFLGNR